MQRRFLARERVEVRGGESEGDGVGEGAVGEGGELGGYGAVEAVGEGGCVGALILWGWEGEGRRGGGVGIYMEKGKRRSYAITGLLGSGGMLFSRAGKGGGASW